MNKKNFYIPIKKDEYLPMIWINDLTLAMYKLTICNQNKECQWTPFDNGNIRNICKRKEKSNAKGATGYVCPNLLQKQSISFLAIKDEKLEGSLTSMKGDNTFLKTASLLL